jgi:hypothetical protein
MVKALICDNEHRLSFDDIQKHDFNKGVVWSTLRSQKAPIVPAVTSEIDTQNFDKFEKLEDHPEQE